MIEARAFPARPGALAEIRRFIAAHAVERGLPDEAVEDIVLAVNEASANAIVHTDLHGGPRHLGSGRAVRPGQGRGPRDLSSPPGWKSQRGSWSATHDGARRRVRTDARQFLVTWNGRAPVEVLGRGGRNAAMSTKVPMGQSAGCMEIDGGEAVELARAAAHRAIVEALQP